MRNTLPVHLLALIDEVEELKTRLQPHDTGHIHTTINVLEKRIDELKKELEDTLSSAAYAARCQ
jgi:hypothetical protein